VLGYPGQVSLSLLPAAEPRPLEAILEALGEDSFRLETRGFG
jgi:hypothetical protein